MILKGREINLMQDGRGILQRDPSQKRNLLASVDKGI